MDQDKPIEVNVIVKINQRLLGIVLLAVAGSIVITSLLLYYFSQAFIPMMCSICIGITLLFFSIYFPLQSPRFFFTKTQVINIEEEELEELQSIMKPW
ncbi:MAG: hypothetical protein QCI00_08340 [Candidatus Thermoplasmatota archaeon]|nr:hypothetical protein [Candidatus Thermoplasmatota archaeon]